MKKKIIVFTSVVLALSVLLASAVMYLTDMGTKGRITGLLYNECNVYENIWNMVAYERLGMETVLTRRTKGAYAEYDRGEFQGIQIPECGVSISINGDEMLLKVQKSDGKGGWLDGEYFEYVYNCETDTLCGNENEEYLHKRFLKYYYVWITTANKYTESEPGRYSTYMSGIHEIK